jgi:hypothetical protein
MVPTTGDPAYSIHAYTDDSLIDILSQSATTSAEIVRNKSHASYFHEYFGSTGVQAKTILVENSYIDRDFLEDYSSFYVRCFRDYESSCKRLHFFSDEVREDSFSAWVSGKMTDRGRGMFKNRLQRSYLGFIVVKPLPLTVVGRTCLQTYSHDNHRRHFPALRSYKVSIFGLSLEIAGTLAFQEQDTVAAACATSALWSTFQATGKLFQHRIPSPVEITKAALVRFPMDERDLPNHGLSIWQMAHAVTSIGLEPYPVKINDRISNDFCLQSTAYAYLRGGIPVPLIVALFDQAKQLRIGLHAVAVTGYSLGHAGTTPYDTSGFRLKASRINEFYAHDDGVGPFARMKLQQIVVRTVNPAGQMTHTNLAALTTSWKDDAGSIGNIYAVPDSALIPLYHKIRIPFRTAMNVVKAFDEFVKLDKVKKACPKLADLEWDIYLIEVNRLKAEVAGSGRQSGEYLEAILTERMPKYIWRATAEHNGEKVLDLILDATDIEQGPMMVRAIEYDPNIGHTLRECTKHSINVQPYELYPVRAVLQWFAEQPVA